jgi:hypothetical protein
LKNCIGTIIAVGMSGTAPAYAEAVYRLAPEVYWVGSGAPRNAAPSIVTGANGALFIQSSVPEAQSAPTMKLPVIVPNSLHLPVPSATAPSQALLAAPLPRITTQMLQIGSGGSISIGGAGIVTGTASITSSRGAVLLQSGSISVGGGAVTTGGISAGGTITIR